ncbi:MAG: YibE/F family protein [Bacteroidales bacterium]|nr:YibE/F family protein [Bacteroidales bacterium]
MKLLPEDQKDRKNIIFLILVGIMIAVLIVIPTGFENPSLTENILYEKAEVLETDNSELDQISVVTIGTQKLKLKILSGKFEGNIYDAENILNGQKNIDKIFKPGDKALTVISLDRNNPEKITGVKAQDFYRSGIEITLSLIFIAALLAFAGFTGLKAIISFIFTALCFWKLLLPLFINGFSPIPAGLAIAFVTAAIVILLVSGVNKKGITAMCGCFSGIAFTAIVSVISGKWFMIPGTVQDYSEALIYSGFQLNLSEIFIASVFISASGALMDVSTDIAASIDEIHNRLPELPAKELIKSGFKIARPVIGSTTTTLLFAYSGGFMFAFMAFMSKGMPFVCIVNSNYISAEILHTIAGSMGLVLTAPLTSIVGGLIYGYKKSKK